MTDRQKRQLRQIDIEREFLTAKDVAARLTIGVSTVWRQVAKGSLPAPIKIGGSTRWRRADLQALIEREAV